MKKSALAALSVIVAARLAGAQTPANCNANLLDEAISRSTDMALAGETVSFTLAAVNRTQLPPFCDPADPTCQVGCDNLDVTADFCCPGPTGVPAVPPDPLCTNLLTNQDIPVSNVFAIFGPFPCVMPNAAVATAALTGHGLLDDGFESPFEINKTIAVALVTTTTTTSTTTTSTTTTTTSTTTVPPATHFDCYETPRSSIPARTVTLVDRFGTTTDKIINLHQLCAPADKNGEDPGAEDDPLHYALGTISKTSGFTKIPGVSISNQFGTYTADIVTPVGLLLPASKGLNGFLPPLTAEHFQCYKLGNVKGPAPKGIHVTDQFVTNLSVDINSRGPDILCVSASKNGEGGATDDVLLCLRTKNDSLPFGEKDLFLTTQFGQKEVTITQFDELCVPSTIGELE